MLSPIESWLLFFASCFGAMRGSLITYRLLVELLRLRRSEPTTALLNSLTTSRPIAFGEPSAALPDEGPHNIFASYSYEVLGNRYHGDRVSILDSSLPLLTITTNGWQRNCKTRCQRTGVSLHGTTHRAQAGLS